MAIAKALECRGISELIELIGRGQLLVVHSESPKSDLDDKN